MYLCLEIDFKAVYKEEFYGTINSKILVCAQINFKTHVLVAGN